MALKQIPWRSQKLDEYDIDRRPPGTDNSLYIRSLTDAAVERHLILWRGPHFYIRLHRQPYNNGHLLIRPYRRVTGFRALTVPERNRLADLMGRATEWLRDGLQAEGYNVGMNDGDAAEDGQTAPFRVHVVPRWSGDTNFMAAVNDTKVVPESLEETYRRLRRVIPSGENDV